VFVSLEQILLAVSWSAACIPTIHIRKDDEESVLVRGKTCDELVGASSRRHVGVSHTGYARDLPISR